MSDINNIVLAISNANGVTQTQSVQSLWSGYGEIKRYFLEGGKYSSVIVKHIQLPKDNNHPRGWNTQLSHQRKLKSYQVERIWYQEFVKLTDDNCRVPKCFHTEEKNSELLLIMEDLDASGFPIRKEPNNIDINAAKACLTWLANFHANFMGADPQGLWPIGTYWHLDTRPDEFEKMKNTELKEAARGIDEKLNNSKYKTIVHGDAKLANFCFGINDEVAAVDFQYVGQGCGMKDFAYFISSCFDEKSCEKYEEELLGHYFNELNNALDHDQYNYEAIKQEWSYLYPFAWADFYRFLDGWSPGHWKMHKYSKRLTQKVIEDLK